MGSLSAPTPTVEMSPAGRVTCDSLGTAIATAGPDFGRPTTAIWSPWDVGIIHTTLGGAAPRLPATRGWSFPSGAGTGDVDRRGQQGEREERGSQRLRIAQTGPLGLGRDRDVGSRLLRRLALTPDAGGCCGGGEGRGRRVVGAGPAGEGAVAGGAAGAAEIGGATGASATGDAATAGAAMGGGDAIGADAGGAVAGGADAGGGFVRTGGDEAGAVEPEAWA